MYASTSARRASANIRRAPSRTISSITDDAADRAAPEPSRSAESETTVSIGSYLPDQRCRAGLAWNLHSVTREGTPLPEPIHRFQALLLVGAGLDANGFGAVDCLSFVVHVCVQVTVGGRDLFVPEPQGDDGDVVAGEEQTHGRGM